MYSLILVLAISLAIVGGASSFVSPSARQHHSFSVLHLANSKNKDEHEQQQQLMDSNITPNIIHHDNGITAATDDDDTSQDLQLNKRRLFLSSALASSSSSCAALLSVAMPSPAWAAKGAAEYDLEYYMRDLFMGNKPEGNRPASNAPPPHPPRTLNGPLLPLLLDDELQNCIPIQELSKLSNIPTSTLAEQVTTFRSKVQQAFKVSHPWNVDSVSDEYYFDLTSYAVWRVASVAIPQDYVQRDTFIRNIGRRILDEIMNRGMISQKSIDTLKKGSSSSSTLTLTESAPCIIEILNLYQSTNYCTSYRLGDKNDEVRTGANVFDSLDDDDISSSGGSVNCLVSVFDPATLGASLQITGEQSRFAPDFVGPTLAAVWERVGDAGSIVAVNFESYFVDPVYRPNPKDFFPNERFYQITIAKK